MVGTLKFLKGVLMKLLESVVIISMGAMILITLWGVLVNIISKLMRSLSKMESLSVLNDVIVSIQGFLSSQSWTIEAATSLMVWAGLLGAALGFAKKSHLGIDYFVEKLDINSRYLVRVISYLVSIFFIVYIIILGGFDLFRETNETLTNLSINKAWVYLALPVSGCFMAFFNIENLLELFFEKESSGDDKSSIPSKDV